MYLGDGRYIEGSDRLRGLPPPPPLAGGPNMRPHLQVSEENEVRILQHLRMGIGAVLDVMVFDVIRHRCPELLSSAAL